MSSTWMRRSRPRRPYGSPTASSLHLHRAAIATFLAAMCVGTGTLVAVAMAMIYP